MMGPWLAAALAFMTVVLVRTPWRAARLAGLAALGAAALRMVVWESYPDLLGGAMAPLWLRTVGYLAVVGACVAAAAVYLRRCGDGRAFRALLLAAVAMAFWWITFEASYALDASHHGRVAGDEGLLVLGVWALYGLLLALMDRWFSHFYIRQSARFMLALGLTWLVLGAFLSNARWADPGYRLFGYPAVLLSTWAAEGLLQRHGEDHQMQGLAGLAAAVAGLFVAAFELRLWLDNHLFFFELEVRRSAESFAYEASVRTYALLAVWGLWAFGVALAGVWLRSGRTRLLSAGLYGCALAYGVLAVFRPGAPLWLQAAGMSAACGGAVVASWLARRAPGERLPQEGVAYRWLPLAAAAPCLLWFIRCWT